MAFTDSVDNLLVKAHLSQVPRPILVGTLVILIAAVILSLVQVWSLFSPRALDVDTSSSIVYEEHSNSTALPVSGNADDTHATQESSLSDAEQTEIYEKSYVYVHVAGAVEHPGVYAVIADGRVKHAVEAAGGLREDAASDAVNLARAIQDGEQVYIPTYDEVHTSQVQYSADQSWNPLASDLSSDVSQKININTANAQELESLPGVGPSTAKKILADRQSNGLFSSPQDIMRVSGIGEKKYEELESYICV